MFRKKVLKSGYVRYDGIVGAPLNSMYIKPFADPMSEKIQVVITASEGKKRRTR